MNGLAVIQGSRLFEFKITRFNCICTYVSIFISVVLITNLPP